MKFSSISLWLQSILCGKTIPFGTQSLRFIPWLAIILGSLSVGFYLLFFLYALFSGDIHTATSWGLKSRIESLLELTPELIQAIDEHGLTPLHIATIKGHEQVTELFLQHGANPNARSLDDWQTDGGTPLHGAVIFDHPRVVELLLKNGATNSIHDNFTRYPLHWAAVYGYEKITEILLDFDAYPMLKDAGQNTALHLAAQNNNIEVARLLLVRGNKSGIKADVNDLGLFSETAVQMAYKRNYVKMVQLLLDNGADRRQLEVRLMPLRRRNVFWTDYNNFINDMKNIGTQF